MPGAASSEVPRDARRKTPEALGGLRARHRERAEWMARAHREHGYTLRQIADEAGLHYGTVSKIIKAWEESRRAKSKA